MKIVVKALELVDRLAPGGIEVSLLTAIPHLHDRGIQVDICSQGGAGDLDREFESLGCAIHRIPKTLNPYIAARALTRLLAESPYAIIHSHKGYGSGAFALAAKRTATPCVVSFHSPQSNVRREWEDRLDLRLLRRAWLAWNRWQMQRHVGVFVGHSTTNIAAWEPRWQDDPARYRVTYNGFEFPEDLPSQQVARAELGIGEGDTVLLHVGSFRSEKDHPTLLRIAKLVFERQGKGELVLVGGGRLRPTIENLAVTLGISEHVRFEGTHRNVWPYYRAADVLLFPSTAEGFGNVLVEAQWAELPLVASDIPAHQESVAPGQHQFLFGPGDVESAAEMVILQTAAAAAGNNPWVGHSKIFVEARFGVESTSGRLASLYADLVKTGS